MTFNRYIFLRMIVEFVGVACCVFELFSGSDLMGLTITGIIAVVWAAGEIWAVLVLRRQAPRRDELSDDHQRRATQFAFQVTLGLLVGIGIVIMAVALITHTVIALPAVLLPTLAMTALVVSDSRYLWLEYHGLEDADED